MNRIAILILLVSTAIFAAQNTALNSGNITLDPSTTVHTSGSIAFFKQTSIIEVRDKNEKLMVSIDPDGKVIYGEKYKPEESAKTFWRILAQSYPTVCRELHKPESAPKPAATSPKP